MNSEDQLAKKGRGNRDRPVNREETADLTAETKDIWAKAVGLEPSHLSIETPIDEFADGIMITQSYAQPASSSTPPSRTEAPSRRSNTSKTSHFTTPTQAMMPSLASSLTQYLYEVEETSTAAVVFCLNHAVMDDSMLHTVGDDLNRVVADISPLPSHIDS
ncbi:uncharacterized protein BCR38DRAFT_408878 [Pseudomassariella vexata]|uniref:Uncharacterized protein n=1 Tax=Pseudomassariella vexata TaxID=1141098 RepID=A0A1Y2E0S9_9PEZI|nr:uncharacterized protein BCR38DRAFT_408878 [Pseudomassariella vexata]ORY65142.1 hypothetical protein BCR38DRAFT_408878 [Pseudomassariella vexata]